MCVCITPRTLSRSLMTGNFQTMNRKLQKVFRHPCLLAPVTLDPRLYTHQGTYDPFHFIPPFEMDIKYPETLILKIL